MKHKFFKNFYRKSFSFFFTFKMDPLITVKETLIWLSICRPPESEIKFKRITRTIFSVMVFVSHVCGFIAHFAYVFKFGLCDPEGSILALNCAVEFICATYVLATVFVLRYRIRVIFKQLSNIYDTCKFWSRPRHFIYSFACYSLFHC